MQKMKQNKYFKTISALIAIGLVIVLDCNNILKAFVIIGIMTFYLCALFLNWSNRKWVVGVILCASILNIYCEWMIYMPYRSMWSAASNKQVGFSMSQVSYVYNLGNADALLCALLRNRSVCVYGNCEMYRRYFDLYSGEILIYDYSIENMDFLQEKQETFWDMGRLCMTSAVDSFTDEEVEILRELRHNRDQLYQLYVSINADKIIDEEKVIVAIDSSHNIYVMTEEEWEKLIDEQRAKAWNRNKCLANNMHLCNL